VNLVAGVHAGLMHVPYKHCVTDRGRSFPSGSRSRSTCNQRTSFYNTITVEPPSPQQFKRRCHNSCWEPVYLLHVRSTLCTFDLHAPFTPCTSNTQRIASKSAMTLSCFQPARPLCYRSRRFDATTRGMCAHKNHSKKSVAPVAPGSAIVL
jgi:hypothetical protein